MKIVILDGYCLNPGDLSWDALRELADLEIHDRTPASRVVERAQGAEAVFTNKTPLPRDVLRQLPDLRYIGVLATGYNIVDVAAAREAGITVTNIPTYGTASVAQFAFALLLELCHHVGAHAAAVRAGEWSTNPDWCFWKTPLVELSGKTMGIVGFGRIGRQVGRIADAMGMKVIASDKVRENSPGYDGFCWVEVDDLLVNADVVSLHCPLLAATEGIVAKERLRKMKRSSLLINTSRGPLVNDHDLAQALNEGWIAGAGLDVLSIEPPAAENPLLQAKNCIVTPHIAWATREARSRLLDQTVDNFRAFVSGDPKNVVS
ncbi:MAG: D-2-hydroxyacid dehydrogenase [Bryobacteraceae bacterium]|nr:D-2-hydroxyacid dehydrogenase [Bryobacterales bacterium]MEB2363645.1 D-2-hydroxyacid dehydrogenase [Bryobacterales bacterium]NUM99953.1 D-2-hydroxyacid dehydrogenase [Bryobacteraceae bacterium]